VPICKTAWGNISIKVDKFGSLIAYPVTLSRPVDVFFRSCKALLQISQGYVMFLLSLSCKAGIADHETALEGNYMAS
jgi:hypothetical protein